MSLGIKEEIWDYPKKFSELGEPPYALLYGNGLTIQLDKDRYSFNALALSAKEFLGTGLSEVLEKRACDNFEKLILMLNDATEILVKIKPDSNGIKDLKEGKQLINEALVKAIIKNHHKGPPEIKAAKEQIAENLSPFYNVYTTNYDLTSYWSLQELIDYRREHRLENHYDHFRPKFSEIDQTKRSFLFVHGGLHIFESQGEQAEKIQRGESDKSLVDTVKSRVNDGKMPLVVIGGNAVDKLNQINSSKYLRLTLQSMKSQSGTLIIFGMSMSECDEHLLDAIVESSFSKIWIPVFGNDNENATKWFERIRNAEKDARFYDSGNMDWWGTKLWDEGDIAN